MAGYGDRIPAVAQTWKVIRVGIYGNLNLCRVFPEPTNQKFLSLVIIVTISAVLLLPLSPAVIMSTPAKILKFSVSNRDYS
jgi:hypothetical protein